MTGRNSFFIVFASVLCTSQAYAMLSLVVNPVKRSCATHARHMSTRNIVDYRRRTIKNVYSDVLSIGDRACSDAYTTPNQCRKKGCVRLAETCAKEDYMQMLERRFLSRPYHGASSLGDNLRAHVSTLMLEFRQLRQLEVETLLLMQRKTDNVELYKKTLALATHKKRCIRKQVEAIEISLLGRTVFLQDMQDEDLFEISYAGEEIPAPFKPLCCELFLWQANPDKMIVYSEPTDKE